MRLNKNKDSSAQLTEYLSKRNPTVETFDKEINIEHKLMPKSYYR